ncbi:class I SAM-dependent methyltransferase [Rhizobium sp. BR 315]|uniref:class I SAM-dependent methyltransferase n=1 Tax=Rhizobium sp. BR 315 TaxID=3040014 RepID=UPI003D32CBAE
MTDNNAIELDPHYLHAKAWAEEYELIDRQFSSLGLTAMQELQLVRGETVLDVGCGTGQTLLQLAERVGDNGHVLGVDIAGRLLEVAAQRTAHLGHVTLIESDAQILDLPSHSVDAVFSRFGVMSFNDPVAAFSNFRRILKPDGRLAFCCWQALHENELDRFPLEAAGFPNAVDERPFSFSDPQHVQTVLATAGFDAVAVRPCKELVTSGDVEAMTRVLLKVGPLGKIVRENPAIRSTVEPKLRKALAGLGDQVSTRLTAAIWIVTAQPN